MRTREEVEAARAFLEERMRESVGIADHVIAGLLMTLDWVLGSDKYRAMFEPKSWAEYHNGMTRNPN